MLNKILLIFVFLLILICGFLGLKTVSLENKINKIQSDYKQVHSLMIQRMYFHDFIVPDSICFGRYVVPLIDIKDKVFDRMVLFASRTDRLVQIKRRSIQYYYIPDILQESGIHSDKWYLAKYESLLNIYAKSSMWAVGMWQFKKSTARSYGLVINYYIDDRLEPVRSTRAFVKHFKYLLNKNTNSLVNSMADYNRGESNMNRLIKMSKIDDYFRLSGNGMPEQTKYYVPGIVALKLLEQTEFYKQLNIGVMPEIVQWVEQEIYVRKNIHLEKFNNFLGDDSFMHLNPQYIRYIIPRGKRTVVIFLKHQEKFTEFCKLNNIKTY